MKKYELTNEIKNLPGGVVLYRIRALKDFADVKAGDLGGFVQSERNLNQGGNAWIYNNGEVYGNALVYEDARIVEQAKVYENAAVFGHAVVTGKACVYGRARMCEYSAAFDNAKVYGMAEMFRNAHISGSAEMFDHSRALGEARIYGHAKVFGGADVGGCASVYGEAVVKSNACITGTAVISGMAEIRNKKDYAVVKGFGVVNRSTTFFHCKDDLVRVQCGCFYGDLDMFRAKVKKTHGNSKMAREYLMIADLMELHFKKE